jgi:hypothetical protein
MPSVSTPDAPVALARNFKPALRSLDTRTATGVLQTIQAWPYWREIEAVALKEYGMTHEEWEHYIPEYQRFLTLAFLGLSPIGMFSREVDIIWHAHALCMHLYYQFCLSLHGSILFHVPQVPEHEHTDGQMCTTCRSCTNCSGGDQGGGKLMPDRSATAEAFAHAYQEAFGVLPSPICWNLQAAEGCMIQ